MDEIIWKNSHHFFQVLQKFSLNIGVLAACVAVSGSNLFLYCYFGSRSTQTSYAYADALYKSEWFHLPMELQKFTIVMIANAQRPLFYHGFGVARLNLDTFCSVICFHLEKFIGAISDYLPFSRCCEPSLAITWHSRHWQRNKEATCLQRCTISCDVFMEIVNLFVFQLNHFSIEKEYYFKWKLGRLNRNGHWANINDIYSEWFLIFFQFLFSIPKCFLNVFTNFVFSMFFFILLFELIDIFLKSIYP